jgi:TolA-binding protein
MNILPYRLSEIYDDRSRKALFEDVIHHINDPSLTALLWAIDGAMQEDPAAIADLEDEIRTLNSELEDMAAALEEQREDAAYWRSQAEHFERLAEK